jgi:glycine/D-amino acid oxidase-like deaminating enzyme
MKDYLIIGCGLAGISFAETALRHNKSITVINDASQNSSKIAGGMYNPVVLKRFSAVWNAKSQLDFATQFYADLSSTIATTFDYPLPLLRKFYSVEEQNNWFVAADKPELAPFLSTHLITRQFQEIPAPFSFGEVLGCGYLDTGLLLEKYLLYLQKLKVYHQKTFCYAGLEVTDDHLHYEGSDYKHIVFAEGFGMIHNPFFNSLPIDGTKGELLIIKAPNLKLDVIVKSGIFVVPMGNDLYKVGATYNWVDKSDLPTEEGKKELLDDLNELITCDYEIMEHRAGVRPTVKDRRPLVGTHPQFKNVHLLNGMGTRGVMLAPSMARDLFNSIEKGTDLDPNIDIKRIKRFV